MPAKRHRPRSDKLLSYQQSRKGVGGRCVCVLKCFNIRPKANNLHAPCCFLKLKVGTSFEHCNKPNKQHRPRSDKLLSYQQSRKGVGGRCVCVLNCFNIRPKANNLHAPCCFLKLKVGTSFEHCNKPNKQHRPRSDKLLSYQQSRKGVGGRCVCVLNCFNIRPKANNLHAPYCFLKLKVGTSFEHCNKPNKQHRPRSDCFWRSSLIRVFPVCYSDKHFVNSNPDNQRLIEQKHKF